MKNKFIKIKEFIVGNFKKFLKWLDIIIEKYIMNNEYILYFTYIFGLLYFIFFCFYFKLQNILLILILLILINIIKYIKQVILVIDNKNERIIIFNLLFILINFLTIFFNVLRNLLQPIIRYIKDIIYIIIKYIFNIDIFQYKGINLIINNVIPIISLQVCWALISIYFFFNIWNYLFDFDKKDMEEKDYENVWIIKYKNIFNIIVYIWLIDLSIIIYIYFLVGLHVFEFMNWILFISFSIVLIFILNVFYVVLKYFLRK